jgi:hypothetical protein
MANVLIKKGSYRNAPIENTVFPLVKGLTDGNKGSFLTVDASEIMPGRDRIRVLVDSTDDFEIVGGTTEIAAVPTKAKKEETDEEVMTRIGERFDIMDSMTQAVVEGVVRSMIVVGPPGVGKSFGITKKLAEANLFNLMAGEIRYDVVKGATTALGLYAKLYEFSREGDVLVFDDCDSILMDELSLNILKAALDTNKKRYIHWNSDSKLLQREGIPNKFEFKGACIFITNIKFETIRSAKLRDHLSALESRSHYIDLTMNTMRDKILRIKQIAETGELFKEYRFENGEGDEILNFMNDNQNRLREMSMRCAVKLADLRKTMPDKWKRTAEITLMKNAF